MAVQNSCPLRSKPRAAAQDPSQRSLLPLLLHRLKEKPIPGHHQLLASLLLSAPPSAHPAPTLGTAGAIPDPRGCCYEAKPHQPAEELVPQ